MKCKHKHWRGVSAFFGLRAAPTLGLFIFMPSTSAWADSPLPPPYVHQICSSSKQVCVFLQPEGTAEIMRKEEAGWKSLWAVRGWHRWGWVSESAQYFVSCGTQDLISLDAGDDTQVAMVFSGGTLIRSVTLKEVVPTRKHLQRTVSHYAWGRCEGFSESETSFQISTVSGKYALDLKTMRLTKTK